MSYKKAAKKFAPGPPDGEANWAGSAFARVLAMARDAAGWVLAPAGRERGCWTGTGVSVGAFGVNPGGVWRLSGRGD